MVDEVVAVDGDKQVVETTAGTYEYDKIIISTGVNLASEEDSVMMDVCRSKFSIFIP